MIMGALGRDAKRMLKRGKWRRSAKIKDGWRRRIVEVKAQVGL
jgi:hypothetical protein